MTSVRSKFSFKSIFAGLLALAVLVSSTCVFPVSASSLSDLQRQLDENKSRITQLKNNKAKQKEYMDAVRQKMDLTQQQIDILTSNIGSLTDKMSGMNDQIGRLNNDIAEINQAISDKQAEIIVKQKIIDSKYQLLKERLRAMYISGGYSELQILLSSSDFSGFLTRLEMIKGVSENDTKLINSLAGELKKVQKDKKEMQNDIKDLQARKEKVNEQVSELRTSKTQLDSSKASVNAKQHDLEATYNDSKQKVNAIQEAIDDTSDANAEVENMLKIREAQKKAEEKKNKGGNNNQGGKSDKGGNASKGGNTDKGGEVYKGGQMAWPVQGLHTISSGYGYRYHPTTGVYSFHEGIDITGSGAQGHNILAAADGVVIEVRHVNTSKPKTKQGYGNCIIIDHGGDIYTLYGHCLTMFVSAGQSVKRGQVIALVGTTGNSTGPHLHFGVYKGDSSVNPLPYIT